MNNILLLEDAWDYQFRRFEKIDEDWERRNHWREEEVGNLKKISVGGLNSYQYTANRISGVREMKTYSLISLLLEEERLEEVPGVESRIERKKEEDSFAGSCQFKGLDSKSKSGMLAQLRLINNLFFRLISCLYFARSGTVHARLRTASFCSCFGNFLSPTQLATRNA